MAHKKTSKDAAKPVRKRAAKKVAPRARKHPSSRRGAVGASSQAGVARIPEEWQDGRVVPASPPAKPLQGRDSQRIPVDTIRDANDRPIPRTVSEWFVRKLNASHKVSARTMWFRHDRSARTDPEDDARE